MKSPLFAAVVAIAIAAPPPALALAGSQAAEIMPLDEVRPGMTGVGYTVIQGSEPQPFQVEILGVLRDVFPKQDMIVARLSGLGLERSNVVAGMSGSPVMVDDRVIGAVAYRMVSFAHEAIAGIVPIESMLRVKDLEGARDPMATVTGGPAAGVLAAAAAYLTGAEPVAGWSPGVQRVPPDVVPIATPLVLSGLRPEVVYGITPLLEAMGWVPSLGGAAGGAVQVLPNLVPGGAVAVQLMRGDVSVTASGTITWVDGNRVFAFGHPFLQGGNVDFPMVGAEVLTVLSSASDSRKVTVPGDTVLGAIRQDRLAAVMGVIGATPELLPVRIDIDRGGVIEELSFEVVSDPVLTPLYLFLGVVNGVQSLDQVYGAGSIAVTADIALGTDDESIHFENLFSSQNQAVVSLASTLASLFSFLYDNAFGPAEIRDVQMHVELRNDRRAARISRVWHDRTEVRPGEVVNIGVALEPYRQPEVVRYLSLRMPDDLQPGPLTVLVGDAQAVAAEEQALMQGPLQPRDLRHLVRLLNSIRRNDRIYLLVSRPGEGAMVNGEALPGLPPSVMSMLQSDRSSGDVVAMRRAVLWERAEPADYVVTGSHKVELVVRQK